MRFLAVIVLAYSAVMLLIHLSTSKILKEWSRPGSWLQERFPPQRLLQVEALYWLLALASWRLWPGSAAKAMVVVFAVIHLSIWAAGEMRLFHLNIGSAQTNTARKVDRFIIGFDLAEAAALVAIGCFAVLFLG